MEKLVLIDGNSLLNRAFYATPVFTTKNGTPTNGVFGFIKLLLKIINDKAPTHVAVAFDVHAPTFRHKLYEEYKAGRKPMPDDLAVQLPILKETLALMGVCICEQAGHEADDIIGTLAKRFALPTYIYTGDRDSYQLVDETTNVCYTRKGVSDILELTKDNFKAEIGLSPAQIIDLKALMGDKSDNIPGVAGIGEKSAYTLLENYQSIDGIYQHIDEIKGATQRKLIEGKEMAYFSYKLATIELDAPVSIELEDCLLKIPFSQKVKEKFTELEFKSLLGKDIFAQQGESEKKNVPSIAEYYPQSIAEAIEILENTDCQEVACYFDDFHARFYLPKGNKEYVLPIKTGLLDVGFYDYQVHSLLKRIYGGQKRAICYSSKETMHRLALLEIDQTAPYEDVSILKYLSEGMGNTDRFEDCLQYHALPENRKAYALYCLYEHYSKKLRPQERKLYEEVELPLALVLFEMEREGICIDEDILGELSTRFSSEITLLTEQIYELAGEKFNLNSVPQMSTILFDKLKIAEGKKKNKDGKSYKTTAEELEKYAGEHEIVRLILQYRKLQKLNSTYVEGYKPLIKKGKIHTTYNQSNTNTGRLSSSNPNLQNIPIRTELGKELRKLFIASEGRVLIDADYSQIELRLLAHFSGCKELIDAYLSGKDIHATTAAQVFGVPLEMVTPKQRRDAKAVNFGIIYGISAFGLGNDLNISPKLAQEYIDKYFSTYTDVKEYLTAVVQKTAKQGYVETLLGRRRVVNEMNSSNYNVRSFGERAAMNMPLQGSSADIIKLAMVNVAKRLKEGNYQAKLVMQIHDELVIDCPVEEQEEVKKLLQSEMEHAVSLRVPLTVEASVGRTWYEAKE